MENKSSTCHMTNEMRLIDANALDKWLWDTVDDYQWETRQYTADDICNMLEDAPTVDAVEVVHGRWLKTQEPLGWRDVDCVECSNCHESWVIDEDYEFDDFGGWNYCPNCGAKMDGGNEDG